MSLTVALALFGAVVLAVRRGETQLTGGLGQIELHAGDTLLLAPGPKFAGNKSLSREFVVVSGLEASTRLDATRSAAVVARLLAAGGAEGAVVGNAEHGKNVRKDPGRVAQFR